MRFRAIRLLLCSCAMALCLVVATQCRRSGGEGNTAPQTEPSWTLALAAPIDHLDVVAREPMTLEHPDGSLFVGGFGASRMKENRTEELTLWKSGDGGTTWARVDVGPDAPRAQGAIGNSDMDLAVAPDGTIYFVTLFFDVEKYEGRQVSVGVSKDVGATWKWTLLSNTRFDDRPWVKVAPDGAAHVIWNDGAGVCHAVSQDGGMTWTERERIHPQGGSSHMAMGPNGEMAVRITPLSASGNRYDEGVDLVAVSADGGVTWRKHAAPGVRDWAALAASDNESIPRWVEPLAWDVRGALYSLWTGAGGVWLARSSDQGETWTTWKISEGPEPAFYPYLVARGPGELAATWYSAKQEVVQAHAARIDVGDGGAPPRVVESPPFEPDCWLEGRSPDAPPLRSTGGEYLAACFLHRGGLAVVSPIENRRDKRFGFSFWKLEERRGGSRQRAEGRSQRIHPLLGQGRGVDHIGIGVRDLEKARRDYEEVLGFKCTENLSSLSGRALLRSLILFEDETLMEFLSPSPAAPATGDEFREWVEKHEGGMSLALRISSAQDAAAYLEARNFEAEVTGWPRAIAGEGNPAQVQYYSVTTPDAPSGNGQVFMTWIWLVEYTSSLERTAKRASRREIGLLDHPNTAKRLHSAWFAVRDIEASLRNLRDAGLEPGATRGAKFLGAGGREVKAGTGTIILLQSTNENGVLSKFLSDHDDGSMIAVSIEVSDLNKARSWIESRSDCKLEPYDGFYGRSIMIPPDMTHGIWLELFQR
jgi:catechol 2,3-dioxygenase-like lactoylglutathione lyase family enzyme